MSGLACGIDVGGTKIAGCVVDTDGTILEQARVESPATSTDAIEQAIEELVRGLQRDHEIASVGVGAAGFVDKARAVVMFAPNLAWRDEPLKTDLEARLGLPVVVENDANAAAWGEFEFGAGKDVDDLLLVTVGTGVGGGIVLDGELYRGAFGVAAEIGHIRVERNGRLCGCGNYGCLEQYGSGTALVRQAREAIEGGSLLAKDLLDRAGGDLDAITGPMISSAAAGGDKFAASSSRRSESGWARASPRWPRPGPSRSRHRWRSLRSRGPAAGSDPDDVPRQPDRARTSPRTGDPQGAARQHRGHDRCRRPRPPSVRGQRTSS